ncbi:2,3-bisphosphoglycerate-dependent phosphoglycerate mutase [Bartonella bacilliformis str. Heidi Mejia]|uniref:2,3-bisphosphoglycerate-dependent phosphoglycerate mutase n=2 Tax=Bartonella bacilliformis TaxID=774 RepID=GPMA_BARBK|nr:2,3-bisphosphoglycerate-dependent phosphoglycerate mutase [Bartonella bacilliformis]A1UTM4.1 RecName: Full=2,3-bisphosphoglycerate-dependent phosphoglycerate mutase; Short=BPG-dependent PGAM; Short=PGAM; Short=Phosphoglyceromutase; Short=dPGM [Bartonella bacilliformis KC583]ABM45290.1 phosphoglycerate mutase, 2,3-bisphosphoglycerate-dependent [Bartonella bacilliformis KC583]AMG86086.1 2,3-bisphosphoglycerate-dependent phosphoglycerate mutase [Bartonella bacilliformis]EKS43583.1 phosphoglycer
MRRTLVLVRHGQSEWNIKNLFTGWKDPDLTEKGRTEAITAGKNLKKAGLKFDIAYTSALQRAQKTAQHILEQMAQPDLQLIKNSALNERDYGDLSGLNKDDARQRWGQEQVHIWRRSYTIAPPNGESLRDTGARVWPYYFHHIQPHILRSQTVLIVAHGNSLRALIMVLEGLSSEEIVLQELATGVPIIYEFNADSTILSKKIIQS